MLKLLDYGQPNPFGGIIGRPRKLAWPVNAYRVTLPRILNNDDGLNPFERVILKLLDAVGVMDARALEDETRIPLDLVKSILLRLQDKAFIDEYNVIIKKEDDNSESEDENAPEFVTALLFRELVTGKILPFLHWLDDTNPLRINEGEKKQFHSIHGNNVHEKNTLTQRDVIRTLQAMKKRSAAFGRDIKMPAIQQITIANSPEAYQLDCPIAIQKSDYEFRIADPFGNGFSLILEKAFEQLLEQDDKLSGWLRDWKLLLRNPKTQKQNEKSKEPFDNDDNCQSYPNLIANLRTSQDSPFRSRLKINSSLEWALFYVCCRRPFENAISMLDFTEQSEHSALITNAAQSISLYPPEFGFKPIPKGKLIDFRNKKAEFGTVLAIAILQAKKDEAHPLRRIVSVHPDLYTRLLGIKKERDEKRHGQGSADAPETELSSDAFMREVVHTLLPDIVFSDTPANELDKDVLADSLLDARANIQSKFGFKVFNRLGANLQDRLVQAERFWRSCKDNDDALYFACDLYAAVQSAFRKVLFGKLPPDISDSEFVSVAEKKAVNTNLCKALPECLRTVKILAIRQTLQGNDQTLGSCAVAFLLMSDNDTLSMIKDSQPFFIDDIARVIACGHGNTPLPLPKDDIAILRKSAFTTIKILMES